MANRLLYIFRYLDNGTKIPHGSFNHVMLDLHGIKPFYHKELEITFSINANLVPKYLQWY